MNAQTTYNPPSDPVTVKEEPKNEWNAKRIAYLVAAIVAVLISLIMIVRNFNFKSSQTAPISGPAPGTIGSAGQDGKSGRVHSRFYYLQKDENSATKIVSMAVDYSDIRENFIFNDSMGKISHLTFADDNKTVAYSRNDSYIEIMDMSTGIIKQSLPLDSCSHLKLSRDGKMLLIAFSFNPSMAFLFLTDPVLNIPLIIKEPNPNSVVKDFDFSPDGKSIYILRYYESKGKGVDSIEIRELYYPLTPKIHQLLNPTDAICISPDGQNIVLATEFDGTKLFVMKLSDFDGKSLFFKLPPTVKPFKSLYFASDGKGVFARSKDNELVYVSINKDRVVAMNLQSSNANIKLLD